MLQSANLALRFILELCGLVAVGYWGFLAIGSGLKKFTLGIGSPLLIAVIWGMFGSPKALVKLSTHWHLLLEIVIFGLPAIALYVTGNKRLALIYGLLVVFNRMMMFIWHQD